MKTLLGFALLYLSIQVVFTLDIQAHQQGFTDQLGLSQNQINHATQCLSSLMEVGGAVQGLLGTKIQSPEYMMIGLFSMYNYYKTQLVGECQLYLSDLMDLAPNKEGVPLKTLIQNNYDQYGPYVIQKMTKSLELLSIGYQDYEAGQIQAQALQILLGIEKPEEYSHPIVDDNKYAPFEVKDFVKEFNNEFYKTIGVEDQSIIDLQTQCGIKIYNSTLDLIVLSLNSTQWDEVENQLVGSQIVYAGLVDTLQPCITALKALHPLMEPFKKTFNIAPDVFFAELAYQVGIKQPEIALAKEVFDKYIYEGEYKAAGRLVGEVFISLTENLRW